MAELSDQRAHRRRDRRLLPAGSFIAWVYVVVRHVAMLFPRVFTVITNRSMRYYQMVRKWIGWFFLLAVGIYVGRVYHYQPLQSPQMLARHVQVYGLPVSSHGITRFYASDGDHRWTLYSRQSQSILPGQLLKLTFRAKPLSWRCNPGLSWLCVRKPLWMPWAGQGAVRSLELVRQTHASWMDQLRYRVRDVIQHASYGSAADKGILLDLVIGDSSQMDEAIYADFLNTGTAHLLSLSGCHLSFLVSGLMLVNMVVFSLIAQRGPQLVPLRCAAWVTLPIIGLYTFWVGAALPIDRAAIMTATYLFCMTLARSSSFFLAWSLSGMLLLLMVPNAWTYPGFWLSYLAVFFLKISWGIGQQALPRWQRVLRAHLAIFFGLMPVSLYFFASYPLIGCLANPIAVPWVSCVVVPMVLFGLCLMPISTSATQHCWGMALHALHPLQRLLHWMGQLPCAQWHHAVIALPIVVLASLGVVLVLLPKVMRCRLTGCLLFMPLLLVSVPSPASGIVWAWVLDVGQGLAVVVRTQHHWLLYDTGPRYPGGVDMGKWIVGPVLSHLGASVIDCLMVSHGDSDHSGGVRWLATHWSIAQALSSVPSVRWPGQWQSCHAGQSWQWDGVTFNVLWPKKGAAYTDNNSSCVLQVKVGARSMLLPGDIEHAAQQAMPVTDLAADVLVVPHHGSRGSLDAEWIKQVHPSWVIYSLGRWNRFGFPHKQTLDAYHAVGSHAFRTDQHGAVQVILSRQRVWVQGLKPG